MIPLITLTTDFGIKDHFIGAIKGSIYCELPSANIVDITHQISPYNIIETAYIIKNSYKSFPNGTIHIIGVDCEVSPENKLMIFFIDRHYFICPDNGVISMIDSDIKPEKIYELTICNKIKRTFMYFDIFIKAAIHISKGKSLNLIGKEINYYKQILEIKPEIKDKYSVIKGSVIYIDNYGNVITNITKELFNKIKKGRNFTISAHRYSFTKIYNSYNEFIDFSVPSSDRFVDGEKLVIFNSSDFLEIAIYKSNLTTVGGASTLLGLKYRDTIFINFQ